MMWQNLGNCGSQMFVDKNNELVAAFIGDQLISALLYDLPSIDQWFTLTFSSRQTVHAHVDETFVFAALYCNEGGVK